MINSRYTCDNPLLGYTSVRYRLASRADLATFRDLLHPGLKLGGGIRERLAGIWSELLIAPGRCSVIEDPSRPHPSGIEGFGASVFVSDAFIDQYVLRPQPYVSAILYEELLAGRSPVLSPYEVAEANAREGLNLLVLHFGLRNHDMFAERTQHVLQSASAAFYALHAGFRLKVLVQEVYGPQQVSYMEAGGFRLISDFATALGSGIHERGSENRPYLYGLRREWVAPGAVNPLTFLFHTPRPRLSLSSAEQRVLVRALWNESDIDISRALGISLDAVKKTWRRTFDRVATAAPYALGTDWRPAADRRGAEKRRFLLEYLRLHPEELRPYRPTPSPAARTPAREKGRSARGQAPESQ